MTIQVLLNSSGEKPSLPSSFMVREPILDRRQEAVAFDLSFYAADSLPEASRCQCVLDDILDHAADMGLLKVIGELRGFINIDRRTLMSNIFQHLPRTKFVFNLGSGIAAADDVLEPLARLAEHGFTFSLNEAAIERESFYRLLPMAEVIKFDLHECTREQLVQLTSQPQLADKKLLAENVDTLAQFDMCLALGFDYFQGYYFARPVIRPDHKLTPSQAAIVDIIALVSGEADSTEIETHIKRDISLSLNLLRLVNSASVGRHRIDSLRQALMVLGRKQLANWLQVMLYSNARENAMSVKPLLMLATTRGKLMELVALRHRPGNRGIADAAFTVGIMSLMDTLFGMPMPEIVRQIPVVDDIGEALLERQGYYGDLLALAESIERRAHPAALLPLLDKFHLDCGHLLMLQSEAFEWSNNVTHAMHP